MPTIVDKTLLKNLIFKILINVYISISFGNIVTTLKKNNIH
jgi:hypothetical protein